MNFKDFYNREVLKENSRAKKMKRALGSGNTSHIRTVGIVSPENPMGKKLSNEENQKRYEQLKGELKVGKYPYLKVNGKYGSKERSFIIYNTSREVIEDIAMRYDQESYIFGEVSGTTEKTLNSGYYEKPEGGKYTLQHERETVIDATNAPDFFTQICKDFKFRIPFFESVMPEVFTEEDERLLNESLDDDFTGHHQWVCRAKLYDFSELD